MSGQNVSQPPTEKHGMERYGPLMLGGFVALLVLIVLSSLLMGGGGGDDTDSASAPAAEAPAPVAAGPPVIGVESAMLAASDGPPPAVGELAPDFTYTLADGTTQQLSDLRGQPVMINFWATWCAPCIVEMPDIQASYDHYRSEGFVVLAVNSGEELGQVEGFAEELGLTIPLIANPQNDVADAYGARSLPTTYFINRDGTVDFRQVGLMSEAFITMRVEALQ